MSEEQEDSSAIVWILAAVGGLMALLFCAGILAAIAIPQFMESVEKAKQAEAQRTMRSTVTAVRHHYDLEGELPGVGMSIQTIDAPPVGGDKVVLRPERLEELSPEKRELWGDLNWPSTETPMYFQYTYRAEETDEGARAVLEAKSDFQKGGPMHTVVQEITVRDGQLRVGTAYTKNQSE